MDKEGNDLMYRVHKGKGQEETVIMIVGSWTMVQKQWHPRKTKGSRDNEGNCDVKESRDHGGKAEETQHGFSRAHYR